MPGPAGASRADIITLLREGHSNREIGRRLHTNPLRVGRIRTELGLPKHQPPATASLEERWNARAKPVTGGHMRWTGTLRGGMPNLVYRQRNYSARRVAFQIANGRAPIGRVLPRCGHTWCIAPEHATDHPMRHADAVFARIFGVAA